MRSSLASTLVLAGALALVAPACQRLAADSRPADPGAASNSSGVSPKVPANMNVSAAWKEIDRLLDEQKLAEAAERLSALVASARAAGDEATWARGLVRQSQVRTALGGLENAVEEMKSQSWPGGDPARAAVELYYAHALLEYLSGYDWEIRQRERVVSVAPDAKVDLKAWTAEQIADEAEKSFLAVWERRESLADVAIADFPYLRGNDYPKGVRSTLRDAVSYLFVDRMLGDSSFWSASESNDAWQLDLGNLLADTPQLPPAAAGVASDAHPPHPPHPLLRAAVVLADLERWHRGRDEPAAELEARLARQRAVALHRTSESDQALLRADLERRLPRYRSDPWWAVGTAELASEVATAVSDPEHRIRARALALAGEKAFPGSRGAQHCRALRAEIEAPDFALQMMAVDGAGRRSLEISHRNLAEIHLRAYPVAVEEQLARTEFRGLFPNDDREIERLISSGKPAAAWSVALPPTADFLSHRTFVTPPLERSGLYLIVASAERSFAKGGNRRVALPFTLSRLVLLEESQYSFPWEVRLVEGGDGRAAAGVEVALYRNTWRTAPARVATAHTDASGRATFSLPGDNSYTNYLLLARRGPDLAVAQRYGGPAQPAPDKTTGALLFTDRAIYRPQQKLFWKVLGYASGPGRGVLAPAPATAVAVWLTDPNGEKVAEAEVQTNRFGTAAGEFSIPAGRPLGYWQLHSSLGGNAGVRVEEYKRPTFEVEIEAPAKELRLNRPAELAGEVRYYFGLPVTSGAVAWRVTRQPELPWWWRWWGLAGGSTEAQPIASGTTTLADDGKFRVAFTPAADESEKAKGLTYLYRLEADVTDDGGETRSGERTVRLGWAAVEALAEKPADLVVAGKPFAIAVRRQDLDGAARPGEGRWRLLRLAQPKQTPLPADLPLRPADAPAEPAERFATPGDRLRPRWTGAGEAEQALAFFADGKEVASGALHHEATGRGTIALAGLDAGAYRLRYETRDSFGETGRTQLDFVVAGSATELALPADIAFDHATAEPGATVRLWFHSGLKEAPAELELLRGEERLWRRAVVLSGSQWVDVPIGEADRGGLAARLTLVADHQFVTQGATIDVPWSNKELVVEFATFRDRLVPGAAETFRVTVKDAKGRAVEAGAAELLASMYDRSLDLFAPFSAPRPLALFPSNAYFRFPPLATNLGASHPLWIRDESWIQPFTVGDLAGDAFVEISPWGIGGPGSGRGGPMRRMQKGGVATMAMEADGAVPAPAAAPAPQGFADARSSATAASISLDQLSKLPTGQLAERAAGSAPAAPVALRSNFAETAFWQPQLLTGADGSATIEFTVPDSVTSWRVWVAALSQTLASGYAEKSAESVKELMIRPYLPRFLREGDVAQLKVVVNSAGETPLAGEATLEITDPETNASLLAEFGLTAATAKQPFRVEPGKGVDLTFPLTAPRRVGSTAFKIVARAGNLSDGELRPLPLLPSRLHLAQSRFVTLKGAERREMTFDDMKRSDPTRIDEQMVVTVDGQLFYSMLDALPYLIEYPYECTEQTLNRFVSSGMLSSLFTQYPAVARAAQEMAQRETPLERFDAADPNLKMALEETPWLRESRGGDKAGRDFLRVLDPAVAVAQRDDALAKLAKAQLPNGGFPWFAGGPASPYMTLYLMGGLARAAEFAVPVPRDMVQRGWQYLAREAKEDWLPRALKDDCCWELLTYLNYVAASYPDASWTGDFLSAADRRTILDFSFKHWRDHQPLLKLQLAATLERMARHKDAQLVLASVMDSAKTTRDEGTFWQPEDRSWLWYNDRIETHAWALRTLMEVSPADPRRDGLVQWLFLNKKLNHWKSTRATAEVLYSLAAYLKATKTLAVREQATVAVGNQTTTFTFEPDKFTGKKNQIVVPGDKLDARARPADATVTVEKQTPGLMFASATWHFSTEELPAESRSDLFGVERRYFKRVKTGAEVTLVPIAGNAQLAVGDEVEVQLSLRAKAAAEYVLLRDPRPAGLEPDRPESGWKWDLGIARYEETRDSGANFFFENLPAGEYTFKYRLRANLAGEFRCGPAEVQSIYAPEFVAYSAGERLKIGAAPR